MAGGDSAHTPTTTVGNFVASVRASKVLFRAIKTYRKP
jgi:hypothetical protein